MKTVLVGIGMSITAMCVTDTALTSCHIPPKFSISGNQNSFGRNWHIYNTQVLARQCSKASLSFFSVHQTLSTCLQHLVTFCSPSTTSPSKRCKTLFNQKKTASTRKGRKAEYSVCCMLSHSYLRLWSRDAELDDLQHVVQTLLVIEQRTVLHQPQLNTLECSHDQRVKVARVIGGWAAALQGDRKRETILQNSRILSFQAMPRQTERQSKITHLVTKIKYQVNVPGMDSLRYLAAHGKWDIQCS